MAEPIIKYGTGGKFEEKIMKEKGKYRLFIIFLYFFILKDLLEQKIGVIGYTDELFALIALPLFLLFLSKNQFMLPCAKYGFGKFIALFSLIGFAGSIIYAYQPLRVTLSDMLLCLKFWLVIYVGKVFSQHFSIRAYAGKIYFHVKLLTCMFAIFILVDNVLKIFPSSIRYGFRSTQLFYSLPTIFVANCVLLTAVLLMVCKYVKGSRKYFGLLLIMMCTSLRSKAFGVALAIALIYYLVFRKHQKIQLKMFVLLIPMVIAIAWQQVEFYFLGSLQSGSARFQLLAKSFTVASDHFPIGAGYGTFASHFSGVSYSPLYEMYGLSQIHGLTKSAPSFVSDSFWPMVMGQFGWIGTLVFLLALLMLFVKIQRLKQVNEAYYASALSIFAYLMISSMAEASFVHSCTIPVAFLLGILTNQEKEPEKEANNGLQEVYT